MHGLRGTIFASFCLIAGAVVVATDGPFWLWVFLFFSAFSIAGFGIHFPPLVQDAHPTRIARHLHPAAI